MMAFPVVFIGIFGVIFGAFAKVIAVLTGRSEDELVEDWNSVFES